MTSKSEKDRAKQIQDRCQNILLQMLKDEDNKYCVDCDAKGPRWASWNLGIFLCIRCAGIHRNLGVHISKVKSVNLDSWTPEQVVSLQQMGNSRARAVYEANLPDSFRRPQNDSSLEAFVRAKYEQKKYIAKEWVPPPLPKVNWDKEIDEEIERQKRKKKSTSSSLGPLPAPSVGDKKYNKSDVIPSIPKPKSSVSPKLGRSTPSQGESKANGSASTDLLGLDSARPEAKPAAPSDDIFSNFFSAPQPAPEKKEDPKPDLKAEEQNFFNQAAPTEKEKSKLTKDSILALYSQAPSQSTGNQFGPVQPAAYPYGTAYQAPFSNVQPTQNGMQPQYNQFQSSGNQFQQPFAAQMSQQQFQGAFPPTSQFSTPTSQFSAPTSQFSAPTTQFSAPTTQFSAPSHQFSASSNQFSVPISQFNASASQFSAPSNQFSGAPQSQAQSGLPQQFGGLNLGQGFPATFAQPNANVASNVTWQ